MPVLHLIDFMNLHFRFSALILHLLFSCDLLAQIQYAYTLTAKKPSSEMAAFIESLNQDLFNGSSVLIAKESSLMPPGL